MLLVAQLPRHLPPHEAASLRLVCRSWRQAVDLDELRPFSVQCLTLAAPAALLAHVHAIEYRPARFYMGGSCGIISSPFKCPLSQLACFSRLACLEVDAGAQGVAGLHTQGARRQRGGGLLVGACMSTAFRAPRAA